MIVFARMGKSLHKIAHAMSTLALLFSGGKTMPRFTGDNIKFTNATVKTLVVPEGKKDKLWFDTEKPRGFFIRKFKSGKATYGIKYACEGQQRRITLGPVLPGNLDKMRALASEIVGKATLLGIDEVAERRKARKAAKVKKLVRAAADLSRNPREGQPRQALEEAAAQ